MEYKNFERIIENVKGSKKRVVIADPSNKEVIESISKACKMKIIQPILVGDKTLIEPLVEEYNLTNYQIIDQKDPKSIAQKSVEIIRNGEAELLMKGRIKTSILMKAVLDKETGIKEQKLLSHISIVELPDYDRFLIFSDGGIVIKPDCKQKVDIIKNAIKVARKLEINPIHIALLSAIEVVDKNIPETYDDAMIWKMADRGDFGSDIILDGPVAMDIALDAHSADIKGIDSPIAGKTNIFVVPDIVSCNIAVKSLIYLSNALVGGIVIGAKVPIILLSRSDSAEIKLASLALGGMMV